MVVSSISMKPPGNAQQPLYREGTIVLSFFMIDERTKVRKAISRNASSDDGEEIPGKAGNDVRVMQDNG